MIKLLWCSCIFMIWKNRLFPQNRTEQNKNQNKNQNKLKSWERVWDRGFMSLQKMQSGLQVQLFKKSLFGDPQE